MAERLPYRPHLVKRSTGGYEQQFAANIVHVEDTLVAFGDLIPEEGLPLEQGIPRHSLLLHLSDSEDDFMVEFNDQGNTCYGDSLSEIELGASELRLVFSSGPLAGRVSLSSELEIFEDELPDREFGVGSFGDVQLESLLVSFSIDASRHSELERLLRGCGRFRKV